jgi:hypothetical protein
VRFMDVVSIASDVACESSGITCDQPQVDQGDSGLYLNGQAVN